MTKSKEIESQAKNCLLQIINKLFTHLDISLDIRKELEPSGDFFKDIIYEILDEAMFQEQ